MPNYPTNPKLSRPSLQVNKQIHLNTYTDTPSITLPTTPTVMHCVHVSDNEGIDYDLSTGIITYSSAGVYKIVILMNAQPSAAGKNIYFYAEANRDGGGWTVEQFSGRQKTLTITGTEQFIISASIAIPAGAQMRFYVWGDSTVYLKTVALGATGASLVAGRLMISL